MKDIKPLGWTGSILALIVLAALLRFANYHFPPAFQSATGKPYLVGYLIGWAGAMLLVFAASLAVYRLDGHPLNWNALISRYRLERMDRGDWLWTLAALVFAVGSLAGLAFTMKPLQAIPLFAPHPGFPPDLVDLRANLTPGVLFGMSLKGKWWLIPVYFVGWVLNILGEEFWYRGWMLPRQEAAFGKYAWLMNGLMFTLQHTYQPWNYLAMLPGSLFLSYAVQRRGNTWLGILWHGILNISLLFFIIQGVIAG